MERFLVKEFRIGVFIGDWNEDGCAGARSSVRGSSASDSKELAEDHQDPRWKRPYTERAGTWMKSPAFPGRSHNRGRTRDYRRRLPILELNFLLPYLAGSLNNLGAMLSNLGRREEALAASQEAVDINVLCRADKGMSSKLLSRRNRAFPARIPCSLPQIPYCGSKNSLFRYVGNFAASH